MIVIYKYLINYQLIIAIFILFLLNKVQYIYEVRKKAIICEKDIIWMEINVFSND